MHLPHDQSQPLLRIAIPNKGSLAMAASEILREAGYRQRLRTDVLVPHQGAGSGAAKGKMLQQQGASMIAYVALHHGLVNVNAMRVVLTAGMLGRWSVCRMSGRTVAAAGFAAYLRGLWQGAPEHDAA